MARRRRLPDDWEQIVRRRLAYWQLLSPEEQHRLGEVSARLVADKRWEAARGFTLTDEVVVTIAAQAAVLVLGLDVDYLGKVGSILVHPTVFTIPGPRPTAITGMLADGSPPLHGEAHHDRGPLLIAWDQARFGARHRGRTGRNVVLHEFAHKIDMLDGVVDGTPPLPDRASLERWIEVCSAELELLRAGDDGVDDDGNEDGHGHGHGSGHGSGRGHFVLDDYAATDPGEFFAVTTEAFFERSRELRDAKPELYSVFAEFYQQDPAARELST